MKKRVFGRKFSRDRGSRHALFRSLVKALIDRGKITTTKAKAKAIMSDIDKLVNLSKSKNMNGIRSVYSYLANDRKTTNALFDKIAPAFANRQGGFLKMVNLPRRKGDFAEVVRIEWSEKVQIEAQKKDNKKALKEETKKPVKTSLKSRVTSLIKPKKKE